MGVHHHRVPVRFGACDPAGIAYFPRFFDWFHEAMESWFEEGLGVAYSDAILGMKLGFPAVHTEADFRRPCWLGETVVVELRVRELGSKSIHFDYRVRGATDADDLRAVGATICVVTHLEPGGDHHLRAIRIPDDLRHRIQVFMEAR